jgi:hypothetical protein
MSGRFTFTAGNTLTAAQLNTNVMDGIPYKIVANTATVTGSLAVTFASAFGTGIVPIINATMLSAAGGSGTSVTYGNITNTGMTLYCWTGASASGTARTVSWTALQMTSTTGPGNS